MGAEAIVSTHSAQTTTLAERIATLDILRGFALLGMIIVHFTSASA